MRERLRYLSWLTLLFCWSIKLLSPAHAQVVPGQANVKMDKYGGVYNSPCVGTLPTGGNIPGATGFFYLYKDSNLRHWLFCDPDGNRYFLTSMQVFEDGASNRFASKFGPTYTRWQEPETRRLKSLGFNALGVGSNTHTWPDDNKIPIPFAYGTAPAQRDTLPTQYTYIIKDIYANLPPTYTGYRGYRSRDLFDPNWVNVVQNWPTTTLSTSTPYTNGSVGMDASPYLLGTLMDDSDWMGGFKALWGATNFGWEIGISAPYEQFEDSFGYGLRVMALPTMYTKSQWSTWLCGTRYANVAALNAAWGSTYSTCGSSATTVASETIGTGTGAQTSFTHTLGNALVDMASIGISVAGVLQGGDCPWFNIDCTSASGGTGLIEAATGVGTISGGTVSYSTFSLGSSTQLASDTFVRANANPLSGSWAIPTGVTPLKILTNTVQPTGSNPNIEYSTAVAWPSAQYSEITLGTATTGSGMCAGVLQSAANWSSYQGCLWFTNFGAAATLTIYRVDNLGNTTSLATGTFTVNSTDRLRTSYVLGNIYLSLNDTVKLSIGDGAYTTGSPSIMIWYTSGSNPTITNWTGGSATQTPSPGSITVTFSSAPANGAAITMAYQYGGWPKALSGGTGLLDEDGTSSWWPATDIPPDPAVTAITMDMDLFFGQYTQQYFKTIHDWVKAKLPHHMLFATDPFNPFGRRQMYLNSLPYLDAIMFFGAIAPSWATEGYPNGLAAANSLYNTYGVPGYVYVIKAAQPDSAFSAFPCAIQLSQCFTTQADRGASYKSDLNAFYSNYVGTDGYGYIFGIDYWQYADNNSERGNYGMVSYALDNFYNGLESVPSASCIDPFGFLCGGEAATYGAVQPSWTRAVRDAHIAINKILLSGGTGLSSTNLALEQPASFSSETFANTYYFWGNANDGDIATSWQPTATNPQTYRVDLVGKPSVSKIILRWGAVYATAYTLDWSDDGLSWTTAFTQAAGAGGVETDTFTAVSHRYWRVNATARSGGSSLILQEMEVLAL